MPRKWFFFALGLLVHAALPMRAQQQQPWATVAQALGRAGEERDGVYRVAFPRSDLRVKVGSVSVRAGLALTSWAAFQKHSQGAMVMGDLVLAAAEVAPVVSGLAEGGVEITAVHNHLLGEQPRVMYIHFHGHGDAAVLARTLRGALARTGTPLGTPRASSAAGPAGGLDLERLSSLLGHRGAVRSGAVAFGMPRAEKITGGGAELGPRMGLGTVINFQAEGSGAVTTGDFVLIAGEVQSVIRALRDQRIEVTALHNHMLDEQPRLFFLHFWGRGPAEELARGLRAALDLTNHRKP